MNTVPIEATPLGRSLKTAKQKLVHQWICSLHEAVHGIIIVNTILYYFIHIKLLLLPLLVPYPLAAGPHDPQAPGPHDPPAGVRHDPP